MGEWCGICMKSSGWSAEFFYYYRAMHLVLFCVRCRIAFSSGLGRSPWALPVGQLKLEVSIKFLREPEREGREGTV